MQNRPNTAMGFTDCPLNDSEIDMIPECYHYSNKCICFMCTCGKHICPSQRRVIATKHSYKSSYRRSFSRPSMTPTPPKSQITYRRNEQKMDLETEYMKKYPGFTVEYVPIEEKSTPRFNLKLDTATQYKVDYPNWGPVDYFHTKRPQHPHHDTKLKFQAVTSYEYFYQPVKIPESMKKMQTNMIKGSKFAMPMQSSSQRDYKKFSNDYLAKHEQKKVEEYKPLNYNPNQFKSTSHATYVKSGSKKKDPNVIRKLAMLNAK
ncbi:hypothetical protein SteCoe_1815 [Stentor coeruleus]|uniref:STOP protein n=1 Tax=Stentor coeruleus TaxID=5963 RepID=A0A1R2D122_9CILI|nr:hypothetical protein SteCoe_1815 [Stentor coeruleus]